MLGMTPQSWPSPIPIRFVRQLIGLYGSQYINLGPLLGRVALVESAQSTIITKRTLHERKLSIIFRSNGMCRLTQESAEFENAVLHEQQLQRLFHDPAPSPAAPVTGGHPGRLPDSRFSDFGKKPENAFKFAPTGELGYVVGNTESTSGASMIVYPKKGFNVAFPRVDLQPVNISTPVPTANELTSRLATMDINDEGITLPTRDPPGELAHHPVPRPNNNPGPIDESAIEFAQLANSDDMTPSPNHLDAHTRVSLWCPSKLYQRSILLPHRLLRQFRRMCLCRSIRRVKIPSLRTSLLPPFLSLLLAEEYQSSSIGVSGGTRSKRDRYSPPWSVPLKPQPGRPSRPPRTIHRPRDER
jgi:hypothetical protein